ncbi:MAG: hypothetical protein ACP5JL_08915, partial [bacterium]
GGAHTDIGKMMEIMKEGLRRNLEIIRKKDIDVLLEERYQKIRRIGVFEEKNGAEGRS